MALTPFGIFEEKHRNTTEKRDDGGEDCHRNCPETDLGPEIGNDKGLQLGGGILLPSSASVKKAITPFPKGSADSQKAIARGRKKEKNGELERYHKPSATSETDYEETQTPKTRQKLKGHGGGKERKESSRKKSSRPDLHVHPEDKVKNYLDQETPGETTTLEK